MKYEKSATTFEEQADQLIERGLLANRDELIKRLSAVSYYRLSGYIYPFRQNDSDQFVAGTSLDLIWDRYCFDRQLRGLVLDAIERIEVSIRTKLVYHFSHKYGPFGYLDERNFPKLKTTEFLEWRLALQQETSRSKETFKKHFFDKYGEDHKSLPLWMLIELMSLGSLLTFYKAVSPELKNKIANEYGVADKLLLSWLRSLNGTRNICAHHARLWNRVLGYSTLRPPKNKFPHWHGEYKINNDLVGTILFICRFFLRQISPTSMWHKRVEELLLKHPKIPTHSMGLPEDWKNHPIWSEPS